MSENAIGELFEGGLLHALNPWNIPDWMFAGLLIAGAVTFVIGGFAAIRAWEAGKDQNFIERAERLGYERKAAAKSGNGRGYGEEQ